MRSRKSLLDIGIAHVAAEYITPDAVTSALETELYDPATRFLEVMGYFIIEHLYVGVTDEAGLGHRRILLRKFPKPFLIKGEDVIIEDKHLYPFISLEQILYLSQHFVDAVSTYVVFREMAGLADRAG